MAVLSNLRIADDFNGIGLAGLERLRGPWQAGSAMGNMEELRINRREFLVKGGALLTLSGLLPFGLEGAEPTGRRTRRPNIVCIVSDDMALPYLGCYGGSALTPNLDAFAARGARADECYCVSSICAPSRFNILTGRYAGRCQDANFLRWSPVGEPYCLGWGTDMGSSDPTLARLLAAGGYRTGFAGKWGVGFDKSLDALNGPDLHMDDDPDDPEVDARLRRHQENLAEQVRRTGGFEYAASVMSGNITNRMPRRLQHHNIEWITQGALDFLDGAATDDRPFFLYVATTAVHGPDHDKDIDVDNRYTLGGKCDQPFACHPPRVTVRERLVAAELPVDADHAGMLFFDDHVGALFARMRELGVEDDTFVVFVADHGTEPGKATCYQEGVRTPMLVQWPGVIAPGTILRERLQHVDIAATCCEIAGVPLPTDYHSDGVSFASLLRDGTAPVRESLYLEVGMFRGVLAGHYKFITSRYLPADIERMKVGGVDVALDTLRATDQIHSQIAIRYYPGYFDPEQLYDIDADPREQTNLAGDPQHAGKLAEMRAHLKRHLDSIPHAYPMEADAFQRTPAFAALVDARKDVARDFKWWKEIDWP